MKLGKFVGLALMALTLGLAGQSLAAEPIKIGVYLPLTGQNAFGGQLELEGVQLALKDMPEVLGRPIELVVVDNKSDKVEAANAVKRLVERDKVVGFTNLTFTKVESIPSFCNSLQTSAQISTMLPSARTATLQPL